jgi:hypothetical protein
MTMKRLLTASVASLVLIASQASAVAPTLAPLNVSDRAGTTAQTQDELFGLSPLVLALIAAAIIAIIVVASNNDDNPSSP